MGGVAMIVLRIGVLVVFAECKKKQKTTLERGLPWGAHPPLVSR